MVDAVFYDKFSSPKQLNPTYPLKTNPWYSFLTKHEMQKCS